MKRRLFQRRNALLSSATRIWSGIVLLFIVLILIARFLFPNTFFSISSSLFSMGNALGSALHTASAVVRDPVAVVREHDRLLHELAALKIERDTLRATVADLTRLFPGGEPRREEGILAGVLSRAPLSPYDTLLVDRGKMDGIMTGAVAYGPGGIPIGTVADAKERTARIVLYSEAGRQTVAWLGEERLALTLTGLGSGTFEATMPREAASAAGMIVYVPGPGAIAFGEVVKVSTPVAEPNDVLYIRPFVNLFSVTWVSIAPSPL